MCRSQICLRRFMAGVWHHEQNDYHDGQLLWRRPWPLSVYIPNRSPGRPQLISSPLQPSLHRVSVQRYSLHILACPCHRHLQCGCARPVLAASRRGVIVPLSSRPGRNATGPCLSPFQVTGSAREMFKSTSAASRTCVLPKSILPSPTVGNTTTNGSFATYGNGSSARDDCHSQCYVVEEIAIPEKVSLPVTTRAIGSTSALRLRTCTMASATWNTRPQRKLHHV